MSLAARTDQVTGVPDTTWDQNIRSDYGSNWIFLGIVLVLGVVFIILMMVLVKFFSNLFRIERAPSILPNTTSKRPNPVKLMWNTLWDQPLPPGNYRSQAHGLQMGPMGSRRLDSEHASLYMGSEHGGH